LEPTERAIRTVKWILNDIAAFGTIVSYETRNGTPKTRLAQDVFQFLGITCYVKERYLLLNNEKGLVTKAYLDEPL